MYIHIDDANICKKERIQEISELCDNEYYMSALGSKYQNPSRAKRGFENIKKYIKELEEMASLVRCEACIEEINKALDLQRQGRDEIKRIWDFSI